MLHLSFIMTKYAIYPLLLILSVMVATLQETFREAFHTVTKTSSLFEKVDFGIFNDELKLWAFNVVTTRRWRYQEDDDENDTARPILVPFGDMFNHHGPPNVELCRTKTTPEIMMKLNFC